MHLLRICCVRCGDGVHTRSQPCSLLASGPGVGKDGGFPGSEVLTTRPAPNLEPRDPLAARGDLQTAKGVGGVGPESQRRRGRDRGEGSEDEPSTGLVLPKGKTGCLRV